MAQSIYCLDRKQNKAKRQCALICIVHASSPHDANARKWLTALRFQVLVIQVLFQPAVREQRKPALPSRDQGAVGPVDDGVVAQQADPGLGRARVASPVVRVCERRLLVQHAAGAAGAGEALVAGFGHARQLVEGLIGVDQPVGEAEALAEHLGAAGAARGRQRVVDEVHLDIMVDGEAPPGRQARGEPGALDAAHAVVHEALYLGHVEAVLDSAAGAQVGPHAEDGVGHDSVGAVLDEHVGRCHGAGVADGLPVHGSPRCFSAMQTWCGAAPIPHTLPEPRGLAC